MATMLTSVLVPLSGAPFSKRALPAALALAERSGARLELVHVAEGPIDDGETPPLPRIGRDRPAAARRALATLADQLRAETSLDITLTILTGPVTTTLDAYIATRRADIVVMSTHADNAMRRALLGSVADHVLRHSDTPVLMVGPGASDAATSTPRYRHVLIPLDGSAGAERIIDQIVVVATAGTTKVTLLEVYVPLPVSTIPFPDNTGPIEAPGEFERRRVELLPHLESVATALRVRGFETAVSFVSHPRVVSGILEFARENPPDLIALATHGHGGVRRFFEGSVASGVIHGAQSPVLVFHAPAADRIAARPHGEVANSDSLTVG
jgi:nucleotide-binding universal stress UspA family protein